MPASYRNFTYTARLAAARANFAGVKEYVRQLEQAYHDGSLSYRTVSLRSILIEFGVTDQAAQDDVIALCGNGGFSYCLDPDWTHDDGERPPELACFWGIDQLRSRLDCVHLPRQED